MTPEAKRIAIAVACGWKEVKNAVAYLSDGRTINESHPSLWLKPKTQFQVQEKYLPDYLTDLNAMHEAERTLASVQISRYVSELWGAVCRGGNADEMDFGTFHASAKYRAEAFLRTIGKWTDE